LTEEFLPYLDQWEESVMARKDVTNAAKKMMMLSTETLQGLKLTGIYKQYMQYRNALS